MADVIYVIYLNVSAPPIFLLDVNDIFQVFGAFMVVASVFVIVSSLFAIFVSVPWVRDRVVAKCGGVAIDRNDKNAE